MVVNHGNQILVGTQGRFAMGHAPAVSNALKVTYRRKSLFLKLLTPSVTREATVRNTIKVGIKIITIATVDGQPLSLNSAISHRPGNFTTTSAKAPATTSPITLSYQQEIPAEFHARWDR